VDDPIICKVTFIVYRERILGRGGEYMVLNYGKWEKHQILSKPLSQNLPTTSRYSDNQFWLFLRRFKVIILKPNHGSGGAGIIKVTERNKDEFEVQYNVNKQRISGKINLLKHVKLLMRNYPYIIQQWVPLATINGKPFDIRVMVQRKKGGPWVVTGKVAKLAGNGYIITNIHRSKGIVLSLPVALQRAYRQVDSSIDNKIDRIVQIAKGELTKVYPWQRVYGFDIALDKNQHIWIIEANLAPQIGMFNALADKTMYRRIVEYSKA